MYVNGHFQPEIRILSCDMVRSEKRHNWNHENLSSPVWRYYWMPKRHARLILGDIDITPGPDEIILIPPNTPFKTRCPEPLQQFVVHFLAAPPYESVKPALFAIPAKERERAMIDLITKLAEPGRPFDMRLALLNIELCLHALNAIPPESLAFRRDDPKISEAMRRMKEAPGASWRVPELAAEAGMSVNSFIRRFKTHAGTSPIKYLARARVEEACLKLCGSSLSVDEIAEELGFCNRNHFTQRFVELMGVGPAAYRRDFENRSFARPE